MAEFTYQCDSCHATVNAEVDETAIDGQLRWYVSYRCPVCNAAVESDDIGFPPDEIQKLLIKHGGRWNLSIDDSANKTMAMKALREIFGWSLTELSAQLGNATGTIYSGTKTEVEWLQEQFNARGVPSAVIAAESAG